MNQLIVSEEYLKNFEQDMNKKGCRNALLVCGKRMIESSIGRQFSDSKMIQAVFSDFESNPSYDSVVDGVKCYHDNSCDSIVAIGGGSGIDVAKSIKAYASMHSDEEFVNQTIIDNKIPFYVMPTTAGTGSEATKFAVIYYKGEKISVEHDSIIPHMVFMDASQLVTLPEYHKKTTLLDAFCHGIESFWSINANEESRSFAQKALSMIIENTDAYLAGDSKAAMNMLLASNLAGKAINISKTTAAHAMCYKLTKMYDIAHGQAAALCLFAVWKKTIQTANENKDEKLLQILRVLAGQKDIEDRVCEYGKWLEHLDMKIDFVSQKGAKKEDLDILTNSVNVDRLKNHPVSFSRDTIYDMYKMILEVE